MRFLFFLLLYALFIGTFQPIMAQESEAERLFEEAEESRYSNPQKSLKLYNYLLKNTNDQAFSTLVEINRIETNLLVDNYQKAVQSAQNAKESLQSLSNLQLYCRYYLAVANLYEELDLRQESKKALQQAKEHFKKLNKPQQKALKIQLELAILKQERDKTAVEKAEELKKLLQETAQNANLQNYLRYQIGKLYYPAKKDSAKAYFHKITSKKESELYKKVQLFTTIIKHENLGDSLATAKNYVKNANAKLQEIWLKQQIKHWEKQENTDSLVSYTKQLTQIQNQTHFKKRQAKVILLEDVYRKKEAAQEKEARQQKRWLWLGISLAFLYLVGYFAYLVYQKNKKQKQTSETESSKKIVIPSKTRKDILEKLKQFENSQLFLDEKMRIGTLAKHLDTNTRYLSTIINASKNKSFNSYINTLRINYILSKLETEPKYANYKVSYLAKESGFASQSSITTAFKEETGLTPSAYIKKNIN